MNIKEIRQKSGLSQSAFAKKYEIPVRTLQQWEQGKSEPSPYLVKLLNKDLDSFDVQKYSIIIKDYKVCIDRPFLNCDKVYPIQQKKVLFILDQLMDNKNVKKVMVFGSSVTNRCTIDSDLDIYAELEKNENLHLSHGQYLVDFWTNYLADENLMDNIYKTGVVVYER